MSRRVAASSSFAEPEIACLEQIVSATLRGDRLSPVIARGKAFARIARKVKAMRARIESVQAGTPTPRRRLAPATVGERFDRWTVIDATEHGGNGVRAVMCRCDCGTERTVRLSYLRSGSSQSCGCRASEASAENLRRYHERRASGEPGLRAPGGKRKQVAA